MAKKSFKNNPALQFITVQEEPETLVPTVSEGQRPAAPPAAGKPDAKAPASTAAKSEKRLTEETKISPEGEERTGTPQIAENLLAEAVLSEPDTTIPGRQNASEGKTRPFQPQRRDIEPQTPPMKLNPMYIETRSKRVQLLMQPSLHDRLRQLAGSRGQSLNDLVHEALEQYAEHGE